MNPFSVLGISPGASQDEVKAAFRRHALRWHPDKFARCGPEEQQAAAAQFKIVSEAYESLKKGNSTNYGRSGGAYPYRTGGTSRQTAWGPQGSYSDFHYSSPRPPRSVGPIAAWYRLRSRVSSLDFILLGSVAAAILGGAVLLDALLAGAWRSSNAGRLFDDVRADRHKRQLALLDQLKREREHLELSTSAAANDDEA